MDIHILFSRLVRDAKKFDFLIWPLPQVKPLGSKLSDRKDVIISPWQQSPYLRFIIYCLHYNVQTIDWFRIPSGNNNKLELLVILLRWLLSLYQWARACLVSGAAHGAAPRRMLASQWTAKGVRTSRHSRRIYSSYISLCCEIYRFFVSAYSQ